MMNDMLCFLSKYLHFTYNELMHLSITDFLNYYNWSKQDYADELKFKQEYDVNLMKAFKCPLYSKK